ncbi:MAG TPA: LLM class F420-dependent oxidoreductase [Acidimicrobiales bacterium]|jgi:probable F420-dependent oxidoreductase|nr:LLM class F420-dependent oxidoreductase [Acidimicrobiales bacterium]
MRLGITAFLTDRDMKPGQMAQAIEARGFDGFYLPEHTHLPVRADTPPALVDGVRLDDYQRNLCPLIALSSAIEVTEHITLGTGILLAAQHDPIVLAKQIATLDHLCGGRFTLGIGFGWNQAEAEDHGVDFKKRHAIVREHLQCMQALWSQEQAEYHGEFVDLPPAWAWPKTVQQPRVRTLIGGGATDTVLSAVADYADGWIPIGGSGLSEAIPRLHQFAEAAGRDPAQFDVIPFGTMGSEEKLTHYNGLGVREVILRVRSGPPSDVLAQLDTLAALIPIAAALETP